MASTYIPEDFKDKVYVSTCSNFGLYLYSKQKKIDNTFFDKLDQTKFVKSTVAKERKDIIDENIRSSTIMKNVDVKIHCNDSKFKDCIPISDNLECEISYKVDLIKYEEGDHFNEFHFDTRIYNDIATLLIFPPYNTFTGGDLVFKINEEIFTLNTSSFSKTEFTMVIFTDILHKCEPITSGTRYVFKTSIYSSMPKILSNDFKFTLEKLEKYKCVPEIIEQEIQNLKNEFTTKKDELSKLINKICDTKKKNY
jgi:uncharacterized protein YlbG (UPF0298 family)